MSDVVAWLRAELDQRQQIAERLQDELWWIGNITRIEAYAAGSRDVSATEAIQLDLLAGFPLHIRHRIAADRKLLDLHALGDDGFCGVCPVWPHEREEGPRPCATVRLLAEGYGWTEEVA